MPAHFCAADSHISSAVSHHLTLEGVMKFSDMGNKKAVMKTSFGFAKYLAEQWAPCGCHDLGHQAFLHQSVKGPKSPHEKFNL